MILPLKQGLKQKEEVSGMYELPSLNDTSIKTRIETIYKICKICLKKIIVFTVVLYCLNDTSIKTRIETFS